MKELYIATKTAAQIHNDSLRVTFGSVSNLEVFCTELLANNPLVLSRCISIDETAMLRADTIIGHDTTVGPYCMVGSDVTLGDNVTISAGVIIDSGAVIGDNVCINIGCRIHSGVRIPVHTVIPRHSAVFDKVPLRALLGGDIPT